MDKISCIVLAGGESKRFGENKAFFNFNGKSFIERAIDTASQISDDIIISVRKEENVKQYVYELKKIAKKKPLLVMADDKSCGFKGPLKGIYTCIKQLKGKSVLIMECDAPLFNFTAASELIKKMEKEKVNAVVPLWSDSTVEPLLACYKIKKTLLILEMLNSYAINLKEYFLFTDSVNISRFLPSVFFYDILEIIKKNPELKIDSFININTGKDFEKYGKNISLFNKQKGLKSVKIRKANRFFDIKNPAGKPSGILANALYYWWIYAKTGNYIYFDRSIDYFIRDAYLYYENNLDFMGAKIIKSMPDPLRIFGAKMDKLN